MKKKKEIKMLKCEMGEIFSKNCSLFLPFQNISLKFQFKRTLIFTFNWIFQSLYLHNSKYFINFRDTAFLHFLFYENPKLSTVDAEVSYSR